MNGSMYNFVVTALTAPQIGNNGKSKRSLTNLKTN